ncbi:MAG: ribonuclease P protein component [Myxococcales bacterium]
MPQHPEAFPAAARLRSRRDFELVQSKGRKLSRGKLLALWMTSFDGPPRLGITASRKMGGAVARNQAKRWIREWFRKRRSTLPAGLRLLVVVRRGAIEAGHAALDGDLASLARDLTRMR